MAKSRQADAHGHRNTRRADAEKVHGGLMPAAYRKYGVASDVEP
ncbi:hypothetical protein HRbin36_02006 [bacterium HR36]|nr:hypothetical protein HRbin36_02006 [bacterium HR36]